MSEWRRGEVRVRWVGGGLYVEYKGNAVLLDAPAGVAQQLHSCLNRIHAVVLTGERAGAVSGLVPLLTALEPHRMTDVPLLVHFPLGAERGAMLAESWVRGWPGRYPLTLDGESADGSFSLGAFDITSVSVRCGEPIWRDARVASTLGVALRVEVGGVKLAWVPGAAPDRQIARVCDGVDLAVIEVGVVPWPSTTERWRLSALEAVDVATGAHMLWVAGDDGHLSPGLQA